MLGAGCLALGWKGTRFDQWLLQQHSIDNQDEQDDMYDEMYQWESNPWEPTNMRQRQRDRRPPVNRVRNSISSGGGSTFRSGARRRRRAPRGARALDGGS